jgi:phage tail tube protein FII
LTGKKKNNEIAKQKQLQKPSKKIAIKRTWIKFDRWKYLLGWN